MHIVENRKSVDEKEAVVDIEVHEEGLKYRWYKIFNNRTKYSKEGDIESKESKC